MDLVRMNAPEEVMVFLVGTHKDKETERQVSKWEAVEKARVLGIPYFEVTNLTSDGPLFVLRKMARECVCLAPLHEPGVLHQDIASMWPSDIST